MNKKSNVDLPNAEISQLELDLEQAFSKANQRLRFGYGSSLYAKNGSIRYSPTPISDGEVEQ
jgi:hypothetical protein